MDGQPFFRVNQAIDPGLIKVIEGEIVPRLEHDVPAQHSAESLAAQPLLHRFTLVFDREGYSPKFVKRMKARRIACLCYHKYPGEDWSAEEFIEQTVKLQSGERVQMKLAERGTYLSGVVWLREIRKLTDSGHQTALLSTDYVSDLKPTRPRPCSPAGLRKISSGTPANALPWTSLRTIVPKIFLIPSRP
jgi:hypothetical protein